ncbi:MAG TPA: GNAT family N-acetyltransferase [Paracoccaceae bacterium]|nr:GNAT family N-acetyltransferase [Paracoccaceae bacterium]HMO71157.1 GNAT family N-acetyltransferase [Paracoccaceae bacterium]
MRTDDLAVCLALRRVVFIEEQGVPEADELDGLDGDAIHLLARQGDRPVGSARLLVMGDTGKVGRVCVLPEVRGQGIGAALIREGVSIFRAMPGIRRVKLSAQVQALAFYAALGFAATGPDYLDAGIVHRDMVMDL